MYICIYVYMYTHICMYVYKVQSTDTCFAVLQLISVACNNLNEFYNFT